MDDKTKHISQVLQATVVGGLGTAFIERVLIPSVKIKENSSGKKH